MQDFFHFQYLSHRVPGTTYWDISPHLDPPVNSRWPPPDSPWSYIARKVKQFLGSSGMDRGKETMPWKWQGFLHKRFGNVWKMDSYTCTCQCAHLLYVYVCIMYIYIHVYIYIYVYVWSPPQDLPKSISHGIHNENACMYVSYTQFHYSFCFTFKLQMSQNTENHSIFVYAFLKNSENSSVFSFFDYIILYYSQTRTVREHKHNRLTHAFAWTSLFLTYF